MDKDITPSVIADSQREVLNFVANHPRAVGLVSVACYKDTSFQSQETRNQIHPLAFSGVDSLGQQTLYKLHQANIYLGQYPLHYPVYAYYSKRSQLALGFYSFVASAAGQKIILDWGLVPATMPVRLVQITSS
jgi:phosphate transport system substrate-binding protein